MIGFHNDFLDLLIGNGLLGLSAFLIFIYQIFKFLKKYKNKYFPLVQSLFYAFITMTFFQGYEKLTVALLLFTSIALVHSYSYQNYIYEKQD